MKSIVFTIIFSITFGCFVMGQKAVKSINFEDSLTWNQIAEKAKKDNKYIFVDFSTTWCVPCKRMDAEVLNQDTIVSFINKNFISSRYQCDTSAKDSLQTKLKYADAARLVRELRVEGYPTYIILGPNSEAVHRIVGYKNAEELLLEFNMALNPTTQYTAFTKEYDGGNREEEFLSKLVDMSMRVNDFVKSNEYINSYLKTQKNLLTRKNIELLVIATKKSSDVGFKTIYANPNRVDQVAGKDKSSNVISNIAFNEIAIRYVRENGIADYKPEAMMTIYSGEVKKQVNWGELQKKVVSIYPAFAPKIMNYSKINYFSWNKDWAQMVKLVTNQLIKKSLSNELFERAAQTLFFECNDKKLLNDALSWYGKKDFPGNQYSFWTKADLLFKLGRVKEAVAELNKNRNAHDKHQEQSINAAIVKIEAGKSRWDN
ncbi:thioredoxin-like protein [Pedobacter psychrotolerans]|uniref:Thioredoxin-like protein n=2 Tax=Pedobacter psychrotolerans TaxID=1843235 RepID=A0A4R2HJ50_9SPHI|nr:thioredoxin family protein [Pedobacter psychrotolerans]TCO28796.1 thioredoxin-like protein [Pedobacter psychrotolerans]